MDFLRLLKAFNAATKGARARGLPVPPKPAVPLVGTTPQPGRSPVAQEYKEPELGPMGRLAVKFGQASDAFTAGGGTNPILGSLAGMAKVAALVAGNDLPAWHKWKAASDAAPAAQLASASAAPVPPPLPPHAIVSGAPAGPTATPRTGAQPPPVPASALPLSPPAPPSSGPIVVSGATPPSGSLPFTAGPAPQATWPSGPFAGPATAARPPAVATPSVTLPTFGPSATPAVAMPATGATARPTVVDQGTPPRSAATSAPLPNPPPSSAFVPSTDTPGQQASRPAAPAPPNVPARPTLDAPPAAPPPLPVIIKQILATPGAAKFGLSPAILAKMPESSVREMASQLGVAPPRGMPPLIPPSLVASAASMAGNTSSPTGPSPTSAQTPFPGAALPGIPQSSIPPSASPPWMAGRLPVSAPAGLGAASPSYGQAIGTPASSGTNGGNQDATREMIGLLRDILRELQKKKSGDESGGAATADESESEENRRPFWRKVESIDLPPTTSSTHGIGLSEIPLVMRPPLHQNPAHFQL